MSPRQLMIILSLFVWCVCVDSGRQVRPVDCEKYVYHPHCRGIQAKKRVFPAIKNENIEQPCVCPGVKDSNDRRGTISNPKLLEAMLNGLDVNTIYEAYAASSDRRRDYNDNSRDRSTQRRRLLPDSTIDLTDLEVDY